MKFDSFLLSRVMAVPYLVLNVIIAKLILRAGGYSHPIMSSVVSLSILMVVFTSSKRRFLILGVPFLLVVSLYAPVGFTYGPPNYQYVASLFATNVNESIEFLSTIGKKYFLYAVSIIFCGFSSFVLSRKYNINLLNNKFFSTCSILFIFCLSGAFPFVKDAVGALSLTIGEMRKLSLYVGGNEWRDVKLSNNSYYDDYFIVIGESARRDYFHLYGYPIENTPFLDKTKGSIVNGLTAGGTYTIGSLRMMLTQGNKYRWEPNYALNIIGLANKAGIDTYWISNQGQFGEYDTPISAIAKQAKYNYFSKSSDYGSKVVSDFSLLKQLKYYLAEKQRGKKRLFIIHTIGSHPNACDRVRNMEKQFHAVNNKYSYIACYISSIKKTDSFLSELNLSLKSVEGDRKFSILYFSDHGLVHREVDGVIQVNNNFASKYHYNIPLVKISSDDEVRKEISSKKSGLMFVNGLASWMGIHASQLEPYDLFDGVDDMNDYGLNKIIDGIKVDDPAIAIDVVK